MEESQGFSFQDIDFQGILNTTIEFLLQLWELLKVGAKMIFPFLGFVFVLGAIVFILYAYATFNKDVKKGKSEFMAAMRLLIALGGIVIVVAFLLFA